MEHGNICHIPNERFGYFGWPSIARMDDGTLIAGVSGLRFRHVCPWGKTVLFFSHDDGKTWSEPFVAHDSPIDDRDVGVVSLGGNDVLITWFATDPRLYVATYEDEMDENTLYWARAKMSALDDEICGRYKGSWTRISHDGGKTWSAPRSAPVSAPHGPIVLKDGRLMYLGKQFPGGMQRPWGEVAAAVSSDQGETWEEIGIVPLPAGARIDQVHEPHVCELPDGTLICHLRVEAPDLVTWQSVSTDGGRTWTEPVRVPAEGSPPHLLRHSSGVLICSYGYRHKPDGQRVIFSTDGGETWGHDLVLRDDGPSGDLGYPATVELADGSLFTVYYQGVEYGGKTSLMYTHWELPRELKI